MNFSMIDHDPDSVHNERASGLADPGTRLDTRVTVLELR